MHYLFIGFLLLGIGSALLQALSGQPDALSSSVQTMLDAADLAVKVSLGLVGVLTLWSGFFRLAERGGLTEWLAVKVTPLLGRLMPADRAHRDTMAPVAMNLSANMLGLDNAATPLGLKAMEALQRHNPVPTVASNSQIMFLVLNTSSVTLVPITVLMYRAQQGAADPADIYLPMLMATTVSTFVGVWLTARIQKIRLLDPVILCAAGAWVALLLLFALMLRLLPGALGSSLSSAIGNGFLLLVIALFLLAAHRARIDAYSTFVEGAKEGFDTAIRLIPFLVAMLVAIALLREAGVLDALLNGIRQVVLWCGGDTRFVDALPVAFLKPLTGSGSRAMMLEIMHTHGVDSFAARLAAIMQGSTETTFYVLTVYFGSVGITRMRHALWCGLAADVAGLGSAIAFAYLMEPLF